jgi:two-component system LytT family sensor kinase
MNTFRALSKPLHWPRRALDLKDSPGQTVAEISASQRVRPDILQERTSPGGKGLNRVQLAVLIFCIWTAVGVFQSVPEMLKGFHWYVFANKIIDSWGWALLTPALLLIDRRFALRQTNIAGLVLFFLLLSIPVTLVHTYLVALLLYPIPQISWSPLRNSDFAVYYFLGGWVTYCAFVAVLQAFRFYNGLLTGQLQLERVEKSLIESRLNALRLHLEPHFLFNALNAISSEMVKRPHVAQDMIADLGALLRLSLDSKDSPEISLAQELILLDHYLSIQKIRFGKRIDINVEVEPDAVSAKVPSMLLQPLVENAIRHGVEGRRSGATIFISASRDGNRLQLGVADNGRGLPKDWKLESSAGHGLRVTLERLMALYPECGGECLTIKRRAGGGTEVTVQLPFCRGN